MPYNLRPRRPTQDNKHAQLQAPAATRVYEDAVRLSADELALGMLSLQSLCYIGCSNISQILACVIVSCLSWPCSTKQGVMLTSCHACSNTVNAHSLLCLIDACTSAGAQLVLAQVLAALDEGSFKPTRAEYINMRSVCTAWRQALLPELCPRTPFTAKHAHAWESPFPLQMISPVGVNTWSQLTTVTRSWHEVTTIYFNRGGQVCLLNMLVHLPAMQSALPATCCLAKLAKHASLHTAACSPYVTRTAHDSDCHCTPCSCSHLHGVQRPSQVRRSGANSVPTYLACSMWSFSTLTARI